MSLFHLDPGQWALVIISAMLIGFAKAGLPGVGTVVPVLMALVFPAAKSVGIVLPLLVVGDVFAVRYYRQHAEWKHVARALPWAVAGILAGFGIMLWLQASGRNVDRILTLAIGLIVLAMLGLSLWLGYRRRGGDLSFPWWLAPFLGFVGGVTTMMANAAGPVFQCYLLALALPKAGFMGTSGWLFLILNCFKVPFQVCLTSIDTQTLLFNAALIPAVAAGALLGVRLFKHIPERGFKLAVYVLTALAAVRLLWP